MLKDSHKNSLPPSLSLHLACVFEMKRISFHNDFSEAKNEKKEEKNYIFSFKRWRKFSFFFHFLFSSLVAYSLFSKAWEKKNIITTVVFPSCDDVISSSFILSSTSLRSVLCMTRPNFWGGRNLFWCEKKKRGTIWKWYEDGIWVKKVIFWKHHRLISPTSENV